MVIRLTKDQREKMVLDIQRFFINERDEEISEFDAARFLDFVQESLSPYIYNVAISDAKYIIEQQFSNLEEEIASLERPIKR